MTLIVEDGTQVANANGYITKAFADAYHTLIGNSDWSGSDADKELAIIQATSSIELLYGSKYLSQRLVGNQSLLWPRYSFYDNYLNIITQGTIPTSLQNAVAEAALMALAGTSMFPEVNQNTNIKQLTDVVGPISETVVNFRPPELSMFEGFRKVELTLYPILFKQKKSINLSR